MLKWLKSLFGGEKQEEVAKTEDAEAQNVEPKIAESEVVEDVQVSEDVAPGVSSEDAPEVVSEGSEEETAKEELSN